MADSASQAKMKALAEYFRNGGRAGINNPTYDPRPELSDGRLSAAGRAGLLPAQNVAPIGMHDVSAPEDSMLGGVGTLDQMAAENAARLQQNQLANQVYIEPDLSGYQDFQRRPPIQGNPPDVQPRQFPKLQQAIQARPQPMQQQGAIEMTPEMEEKLFGKKQEEEE